MHNSNYRIFFISRHPDIDHICSYILKYSKDYRNYIIARDDDSQLNNYILKYIFKKKYAIKINRINFKNLNLYIYPLLIIFLFTRPLIKIIYKNNYYSKIQKIHNFFEQHANNRLINIAKGADIYLDHRNTNRDKDYLLETLSRNSRQVISLPHSYHYLDNVDKYKKTFDSYKNCWANKIYFYGDEHKNKILDILPKNVEALNIQPYRFNSDWFRFRCNAFREYMPKKVNSLNKINKSNKEIVVFVDSPFNQLEYQKKRRKMLDFISQYYLIIHVPHPRSGRASFRTSEIVWGGEMAELIVRFNKFLGIFSTLSIDFAQTNKLYITCNHLREPGYNCYDEHLNASKRANNDFEILELLKTIPNINAQKQFLKKLKIDPINIQL